MLPIIHKRLPARTFLPSQNTELFKTIDSLLAFTLYIHQLRTSLPLISTVNHHNLPQTNLKPTTTMLFTRTLIISTLTLLANTQTAPTDAATPTITPAALPTQVIASIENYYSSLETQPEFSSAIQALTSAMPASILNQIENDPADYLSSVLGAGAQQSWISAVPTSYISYFSSIGAAEASIITQTAAGPAPTNGPRVKVVGAALAMGAAGLALL